MEIDPVINYYNQQDFPLLETQLNNADTRIRLETWLNSALPQDADPLWLNRVFTLLCTKITEDSAEAPELRAQEDALLAQLITNTDALYLIAYRTDELAQNILLDTEQINTDPLQIFSTLKNNSLPSTRRVLAEKMMDTDENVLRLMQTAIENNDSLLLRIIGEIDIEKFQYAVSSRNNHGESPVYSAINNLELIQILAELAPAEFSVALTLQDEIGYTPLHQAVVKNNVNLVQLLDQLSPKNFRKALSIPDNEGRTPVHLAANFNNESILNLMETVAPKEFCQSLVRKDNEGYTPLRTNLSNRPQGSLFYTHWLGEFSFVPDSMRDNDETDENLMTLDLQLNYWIETNSISPLGRTILEVPLLLGEPECFYNSLFHLSSIQLREGLFKLKEKYGDSLKRTIEEVIGKIIYKIIEHPFNQIPDIDLDILQRLAKIFPEEFESVLLLTNEEGNTYIHDIFNGEKDELLLIFGTIAPKALKKTFLIQNNEGNTPLAIAVLKNRIEFISIMAEIAPEEFSKAITIQNILGQTPFFLSMIGDIRIMQELMNRAPEICLKAMIIHDIKGETPLFAHMIRTDLDVSPLTRHFLEGYDFPNLTGSNSELRKTELSINLINWVEQSPLPPCPPGKSLLEVPLLLGSYSSFENLTIRLTPQEIREGFTFLRMKYGDRANVYIEQLFIKSLDYLLSNSSEDAFFEEKLRILQILASASPEDFGRAFLLKTPPDGNTYVSLAAIDGNQSLLELMAHFSPDYFKKAICTTNIHGNSPLIFSAAWNELNAVQLMYNVGPKEVEEIMLKHNSDSDTPVSLAAKKGLNEMLQLLEQLAPKTFSKALLKFDQYDDTPLFTYLIEHPVNSAFVIKWLGDHNFLPRIQGKDLNENANLVKSQLMDWVLGMTSPLSYPEGRTPLEVPLLLGNFDAFLLLMNKLSPTEREKGSFLLLGKYGDAVYPFLENAEFSVDSAHYNLGADIEEKLPPPSPLTPQQNYLKIEAELKANVEFLDPSIPKGIKEMIEILSEKQRINGLSNFTEDEVNLWYEARTRFLFNALEFYKIGEVNGDIEDKQFFLKTIGEMAPHCTARWEADLKLLYRNGLEFRNAELKAAGKPVIEIEELSNEISIIDIIQGRERKNRLGIALEKLNLFEPNTHEPNYFIDLLNEPLGLRQKKINDPNANFNKPEFPNHTLEKTLERFYKLHTPYAIIQNLVDHVHHQQKTDTKLDPLDVKPNRIMAWADRIGENWNESLFDPNRIRQQIAEMEERGVPAQEISQFLQGLGIIWEGRKSIPEAIFWLQEQILEKKHSVLKQEKTLQGLSKGHEPITPTQKKLQDDIAKKKASIEKLEALLTQIHLAPTDGLKEELIDSSNLIPQESRVPSSLLTDGEIKNAQKRNFLTNVVVDEMGFYTRKVILMLLTEAQVIKHRPLLPLQ